jgi:hypothetical protein
MIDMDVIWQREKNLIVTGRENFKNFKAVFPITEVRDFLERSL